MIMKGTVQLGAKFSIASSPWKIQTLALVIQSQ